MKIFRKIERQTLEEFIGLPQKCYSLLFYGKVENNMNINLDRGEKQVAKKRKDNEKKASSTSGFKIAVGYRIISDPF